MIGVIVIAHGKFGEELFATMQLIVGPQPGVVALGFAARDSLDTLRARVAEAVGQFRADGCLILTDILGGSAANVCVELTRGPGVKVLTGVNLPMLIEAVQHRERLQLPALAQKAREAGVKGILDLEEFIASRQKKKPAGAPTPTTPPAPAPQNPAPGA